MKTIPLFDIDHRLVGCTIVDDDDYDRIARYSWRLHKQQGYAVGQVDGRTQMMHRVILGAEPGQIVDHIDRCGLNNTRANLRFCTHAENMQNRRPNQTNAWAARRAERASTSL